MAEINWNLLSAPNPLAYALDGYQSGQQAAAAREKAALVKRSEDREEAQYQAGVAKEAKRRSIAAKYATDPTGARADAVAEGITDLPQAWSAEEKLKLDEVSRKVDGGASAAGWLLKTMPGAPPEQRKAAALQNASSLARYGITPDDIEKTDFSDQGLNAAFQLAQGWKGQVDQATKEREAALAQQKADEDARHNRAMEANGATNAAANSLRAKKSGGKAKGGAGIPPPPSGWSPKAGG